MHRFAAGAVLRALLLAAAIVLSGFLPALAAEEGRAAALEGPRAEVQQIEAALGRADLRDEDLEQLKGRIDPVRQTVRESIAGIEPRFAELEARLKELGKKPDANAPPEDAKITAERDELSKRFSETDGELKQARLLALRVDQLGERIIERRRALFTAEILAHSDGILSPAFWLNALGALPGELRSLRFVALDWWRWIETRSDADVLLPVLASFIALGGAAVFGWRWWRRRPRHAFAADAPRMAKAAAGWRALASALPQPVIVAAIVGVLSLNQLMPPRVAELAAVLLAAAFIAAMARGTSLAVLAPDQPARRLIAFSDAEARRLHVVVTWSARAFAIAVVLNALHKAVVAPVSLTLATSALMALAIAGLVGGTLFVSRPGDEPEAEPDGTGTAPADVASAPPARSQPWLRAVGWLIVAVLTVALVVGYVGLAAYIAGRLVVATILLGIVWLVIAYLDAAVAEALSGSTARGRRTAAMLGVAPGTLDVAGTLVSGLLKLALSAVAVFVVVGPWGVHAVDVTSTFSGAFFGLQLGNLTLSALSVLGALALFVGGLLATRALQRWLEVHLLPRTRLDASLQNSVRQIVGYTGFIIATMVALAQLGIDLQSIALVAGALSVGIGFGLQSIVSNFVSGLILLTERPIRVGDTINVSGEEGYVRRISVRATEIETFERSTVIVPNSQLITGVVKNWTHANTTGRIIIPVQAPYSVDPDLIRDLLIDAACDHPKILQTPAPRVFLLKFGDTALNFELRCVVSNVDYSLTVRSDLHFSILHRFRKAGIRWPVVPPAAEPVAHPGTPPAEKPA